MKVNGMTIGALLEDAGAKYQSATALYSSLFFTMRKRGVVYEKSSDIGNIKEFIFGQLQREGLWETEDDIKKASALNTNWYHRTTLFLDWVIRNYESYSKKKVRKSVVKAPSIRTKKEKGEKRAEKRLKALESFQKSLEGKKDKIEYIDLMVSFLTSVGYHVEKKEG